MGFKLTLTPKKILMVIILVLGGYVFSQLPKYILKKDWRGTSFVKIGDTITKARFIGFISILIFVVFLLSHINASNKRKHKSKK